MFLQKKKTNFVSNDFEKWSNLAEITQIMVNGHAITKSKNYEDGQLNHDLLGKAEKETDYFSNNFEDIVSQCSFDILYVYENLKQQWALQMIDSFGKPSSGLLEGNFAWPGSYDECISVHAPLKQTTQEGNFKGKYCTVNWSLGLANKTLPVSMGVCVPGSCSATDLNQELALLLKIANTIPDVKNYTSHINFTTITCSSPLTEFSSVAIGMMCLLSFFGSLVLFGSSITAYEYFQKSRKPSFCSYEQNISENDIEILKSNEKSRNDIQISSDDEVLILSPPRESFNKKIFKEIKPFMKCFCAFTNGSKILNTDSGEGQLLCIHGIRFLSMTWVILGHTYAFCTGAGINNPKQALDAIDTFPFQIVFQGFYSVDSFFVLSGFLLTYLYFKEMSKRDGKISWIYFYVHRYIRLTPVYMIMLGFYVALSKYLGSGPHWQTGNVDENCSKYWWRNLLYINNFWRPDTMCVGWSWYLSNDMQFYVISPLFLYTLWRWPKIGFSIIGTFLCATFACNWILTYEYDLVPGMSHFTKDTDFGSFMMKFQDYFNMLYIKPYARIGPYLIGVLLGYIYFKSKDKRTLTSYELFFGWLISTLLTLSVMYGLYHTQPNIWVSSLYNAFGRTCFGIGLSWVIYSCLISGGIVDKILSFKGFIPLSRLTYCAYLVHPIIMNTYYLSFRQSLEFNQATMVTIFLGMLVISYGVAFITTLVFESPVMGLEKEIAKKFKRT